MSVSRSQVLNVFKRIHKARKEAFEGDTRMLLIARNKINEEFRKNKAETDAENLEKLMRTAEDVEATMRTMLVQVEHVGENTQRFKIRESTHKFTNSPYDPNAVPPTSTGTKCCSTDNNKPES